MLFSDPDAVPSTEEVPSEDENGTEGASPEEFFEVEEIFSNAVDGQDGRGESGAHIVKESLEDDDSIEIIWKEEVEHHAFQDCASDEVNHKQEGKSASETNILGGRDNSIASKVVVSNVSSKMESEPLMSGDCGPSEDGEQKQDKEDTLKQKKLEREGVQQKMSADINKQKSDKTVSSLKKQSFCNSKPSADGVGPKNKSKQQEPQGTVSRQAKPNAVSRWIPPNKGLH